MRILGFEIRKAGKDAAITPDFIPRTKDARARMRNALMRMEHDLTHNPYAQFGLDLGGLSDEDAAQAMATAPMYHTVYQGVVPTPELVAAARSGAWRTM